MVESLKVVGGDIPPPPFFEQHDCYISVARENHLEKNFLEQQIQ